VKVTFSQTALESLTEIGDFIAEDSRTHARDYVRRLTTVARQIGNLPLGYPVYANQPALRRRAFENYLIFYRVEAKQVVIVQILHGARDVDAALARAFRP
jgi:toxin ParE1/3/4